MKYWEMIANHLSKAGWSWGCVSVLDSEGRTIWIANAHRGDGERFIMRADEKPTAFLELELAVLSRSSHSSFVRVKTKRFFRRLVRGKNRRGSNHGLQLFNPISGCLWYPCCL
jgi:hypothetical protein